MATAQAADAYWRLLGEMNRRYMGDLRALEAVVEQYKKPPLSAVRTGGRASPICRRLEPVQTEDGLFAEVKLG